MAKSSFNRCVFINCPFDDDFEPLLSAIVFCIVSFGLKPRLATERLEAGESRLDKIVSLMKASKFSIHDISRCKAVAAGDDFRMNMPFEYGLDYGLRHSGDKEMAKKRFLIFENLRFDLKKTLSDTSGHDVFAHEGNFEKVFGHVRDFFSSETSQKIPGALKLQKEYYTCQGWIIEKMMSLGHSEQAAKHLPTRENVAAMEEWISLGKPVKYSAKSA